MSTTEAGMFPLLHCPTAERRSFDIAFTTAERLGLITDRWGEVPKPRDCPWHLGVLYGRNSEGADYLSQEVWHELGHAVLAPPQGWLLNGWGQGGVYDGDPGGLFIEGSGEEEEASALGIWMHAVIGQDLAGAARHAYEHRWISAERSQAVFDEGFGRILIRIFNIEPENATRVRQRLIDAQLPLPIIPPAYRRSR